MVMWGHSAPPTETAPQAHRTDKATRSELCGGLATRFVPFWSPGPVCEEARHSMHKSPARRGTAQCFHKAPMLGKVTPW